MHALKLVEIGDEVGLILPPTLLEKFGWTSGDLLSFTESANGLLLSVRDPQLQAQLQAGREFMGDFRDTFRALSE